MKIDTNQQKIEKVLTRGVQAIYPSKEELEKVLKSGKQLKLYNGIDPSGPTLHIGHGVVLRKLRQFQDLGHKVILLIGDFTGMIGDPTDKTATRVKLSRKEVLENCKNYKRQAGKILDMKKVEIKYNSKWLAKLKFSEIIELVSEFTVQQMLERDMFENRMKEEKPIYLHEFLYPLMQGYDSVAMDVDLEVGGNDQTFNMLAGRTMMKNRGKEKFVLTTRLLVDPTGKKMGKSEGNMITLEDSPEEMYGKVMSWPDTLIINGFEICTDIEESEIKKMEQDLKSGKVNPRDLKMQLAREVVKSYYSEEEAEEAEEHFVKVIQKHEAPEEVEEIKLEDKSWNIVDLLIETKLVGSRSEVRRLVDQKGVKVNEKVVENIEQNFDIPNEGLLIQKGKRHFIRVVK